MNIILNKEPISIAEQTSVTDLIESQSIVGGGVAVAVNNKVVSKGDWATHQLCENDKVTIIIATFGG